MDDEINELNFLAQRIQLQGIYLIQEELEKIHETLTQFAAANRKSFYEAIELFEQTIRKPIDGLNELLKSINEYEYEYVPEPKKKKYRSWEPPYKFHK